MNKNLTEAAVKKRDYSRLEAIDELKARGAKAEKDFRIGGKNPSTEAAVKKLLIADIKSS